MEGDGRPNRRRVEVHGVAWQFVKNFKLINGVYLYAKPERRS